jgi:hypothetical protein
LVSNFDSGSHIKFFFYLRIEVKNKEYEENKWERKFDPVDNQQKMAIVQ